MPPLAEVIAEVQTNWLLYVSMPFTCGIVGYVTNVIAIKMMFLPLEFVGKPPLLGWQGIVPRKAGKMASIACDTLVPKLVSEKEIFERIDPVRLAAEIREPLLKRIEEMIEEIMIEYEPGIWESLPLTARKLIIRRVQEDAPEAVAEIMEHMTDEIEHVFDLKEMVVTTLVRDKELINRVFLETGRSEFDFIGKSGFYFGFLFGLVQMVGWMFFKSDWQLPAFGLAVGYATNWIALQMIFKPQAPRRFGPLVIQGLFHKRQAEVARDYSKLIADEIVTPSNIIEAVLKGPYADNVFNMIAKVVKRTIDEQSGVARPFVAWTVGTRRYVAMKEAAAARFAQQAPETLKHANNYAKEAMDLAGVMSERLAALPPDEFEAMLRPAFQEDEWILIAVGAALGFLVGVGQFLAFKAMAGLPAATAALPVLLATVTG